MNEEMKQKLEKYMKENGYYDTAAIRRDEGYDRLSATFFDIFGDDEDQQETKSELLAAAEAYNDEQIERERQSMTAEVVMEAAIAEWQGAFGSKRIEEMVYKMADEQRAVLGRMAIARQREYKRRINEHDYQTEDQRNYLLSRNNRMLDLIVYCGRGRGFGDHADQSAGVVIDDSAQAPEVNELIEEELARIGL